MSEYLRKNAVLEWLKEQQNKQEEKRDRLEIDHPYREYHEGASDYLSLAVEKIESGAFDAPEMEHINAYWAREGLIKHQEAEVQRLRAWLIQALNQWEMYADMHRNVKGYHCIAESTDPDDLEALEFQRLWSLLGNEALSTTTELTSAAKVERVREGEGNDA